MNQAKPNDSNTASWTQQIDSIPQENKLTNKTRQMQLGHYIRKQNSKKQTQLTQSKATTADYNTTEAKPQETTRLELGPDQMTRQNRTRHNATLNQQTKIQEQQPTQLITNETKLKTKNSENESKTLNYTAQCQ